jgi:S-adenosylmethionine:tRNA ribosyltransferase-isomerase
MRVDQFDFDLPENLIALHPVEPRDFARMLVVADGTLADHIVADLRNLLRPGDILVINDTRVIPAELAGFRTRGDSRRKVSFNLHMRRDANTWLAFARPAKQLLIGDRLELGENGQPLLAAVTGKGEGDARLRFARR